MNVLVLVEDYPNNNGGVSLMYVHTRNIHYLNAGVNVTVLSFKCKNKYAYDGIKVIPLNDYIYSDYKYDTLILHAANIKHHYFFLKKFEKRFKKVIFFYHGHEVLKVNKVYSRPYSYVKKNLFVLLMQDIYDILKLNIWRKYIPKILHKSEFVFVSKWMENEFYKWTGIDKNLISTRSHIIYNCIGEEFEKKSYDDAASKEFDFVTIRSFLDGSKYAIDLVNSCANNTKEAKFLVIGKGKFFNNYKKADNITWIDKYVSHDEIIKYLNLSRYALMPTRTDAQGLMMCEMAAFGIPVITSDIEVCHEVFDGFENAFFIKNNFNINLSYFLNKKTRCIKDKRFTQAFTIDKEIKLINYNG